MGIGLRRASATLLSAGLIGSALLVASGPTAGAATTTTTSTTSTTFTKAKVVSGLDDSEPGIDVAPDGTLYINAIGGLPTPPANVWRSSNAGSSWTLLPEDTKAAAPGGGDADIAVDPTDGSLYETDLWLGDSTASVSHDKGQTWLANPIQGLPVQDRQWVASSGGGIVYHAVHQIPAGIVVSKSVGGLVYPVSSEAATPLDQTGCICPPGNLIAEGGSGPAGTSDKVGVIYATSIGGVNFAQSTDGGLTFTNVAVSPANANADPTTNFPVVANAGGGKLAAVWTEIVGNRSRIRFASSKNWGSTWSAPKTLISAGTSVFPWVAAKGSKIAVSLYHTSAVGTPDTVPNSALWYEQLTESLNGGATFTTPVTADPTPVKKGVICTSGINCSGGRELGDFQQVALDRAGRANMSYNRSVDNVSDVEVRFVREA